MPEEWSGTLRLLQNARGHEMKLDLLANHLYNQGVLAPEIYHAPEILAYDLQRFGVVTYDAVGRTVSLPTGAPTQHATTRR